MRRLILPLFTHLQVFLVRVCGGVGVRDEKTDFYAGRWRGRNMPDKATREPQTSNKDTLKKLAHVCICLNCNCMIHAGMQWGGGGFGGAGGI